ncbi:MAG: LexA family transcriptional regulator [Candidatus Omnitrophota bacterium]
MELKDRIKALRKKAGIQQKTLAYALEISQSTVSHWESGRQEPNPAQRRKLAKFLNITEAELFGGSPPIKEGQPEYQKSSHIPVVLQIIENEETGIELKQLEPAEDINFTNCQAIKITTNSMAPIVLKGQKVIYRKGDTVANGDLVLVTLKSGKNILKKYFKSHGNDLVTLQSLNVSEVCEPLIISEEKIRTIYKVVGIKL